MLSINFTLMTQRGVYTLAITIAFTRCAIGFALLLLLSNSTSGETYCTSGESNC